MTGVCDWLEQKVLVVGSGSIGQRHIRNLHAVGVRRLAVCDPDRERLASIVKEIDALPFTDYDDALAAISPHIVFICTPPVLHTTQALKAVKTGAHIFIEKPLTHSHHGINELLAEIESRGTITMVGCNMRFHPGPSTIKRLVEEGCIGDVITSFIQTGSYMPEWRPHRDYKSVYSAKSEEGGGAVLDCIHEIDLALWYFGPIAEVAAMPISGHSIEIDAEGGAQILARHENGLTTSLNMNFVQRDYRRQCQVIGTRGTLYWDFQEPMVKHFDGSTRSWKRFELPVGFDPNQMFLDEVSYYLQHAKNGQKTFCDARQGWRAVAVALAVKESSTQHKFVAVECFEQLGERN